jgi:hypothetical protein
VNVRSRSRIIFINVEVGHRVASMPEVYNHLTDILATRNIEVGCTYCMCTVLLLRSLRDAWIRIILVKLKPEPNVMQSRINIFTRKGAATLAFMYRTLHSIQRVFSLTRYVLYVLFSSRLIMLLFFNVHCSTLRLVNCTCYRTL